MPRGISSVPNQGPGNSKNTRYGKKDIVGVSSK